MSARKRPARSRAADPIQSAIDKAAEGLSEKDRDRFDDLVRLGFKRMASSAPPETLAEELDPALEVADDDRLAWAEAFALEPAIRTLNRRARDMMKSFAAGSGTAADLEREARAITAGLDGIDLEGLRDGDRRRLQRQVGEARIESRHVLSGGEGPRSLRGGRIGRKSTRSREGEPS